MRVESPKAGVPLLRAAAPRVGELAIWEQVGCKQRQARDPLGVMDGEQHATDRQRAERHDDRAIGRGLVHYRKSNVGERLRSVRGGVRWPVALAVAASVERQEAEVTAEVRDLALPKP